MTKEHYDAIASAVRKALSIVGIEGLRKTSMFPSSYRKDIKKDTQKDVKNDLLPGRP
jgi:hypothetical protein